MYTACKIISRQKSEHRLRQSHLPNAHPSSPDRYCKRIYQPGTPTAAAYLWLLRIYLRPTSKPGADLLRPALALIGRHSPRIDPVEALNLLPPLVTAQDARTFLMEALRAPIFDTRVRSAVGKARDEQLARKLVALETRRVKVTDSRT